MNGLITNNKSNSCSVEDSFLATLENKPWYTRVWEQDLQWLFITLGNSHLPEAAYTSVAHDSEINQEEWNDEKLTYTRPNSELAHYNSQGIDASGQQLNEGCAQSQHRH